MRCVFKYSDSIRVLSSPRHHFMSYVFNEILLVNKSKVKIFDSDELSQKKHYYGCLQLNWIVFSEKKQPKLISMSKSLNSDSDLFQSTEDWRSICIWKTTHVLLLKSKGDFSINSTIPLGLITHCKQSKYKFVITLCWSVRMEIRSNIYSCWFIIRFIIHSLIKPFSLCFAKYANWNWSIHFGLTVLKAASIC